ncbi:hypothetical protein CY35_05G021000 [Sphagnum magellanicum]|nr:hypothetical protein CY35_05G021000 [Sphagnum magellanicum]
MSTLNGSRREIIAGSPSSPPPHLVMVPTPGLGHENPFLQAARRIADEGIIVTYVSTDRHISQVLNRPEFVHLRSSSTSSQLLRFVNFRDGLGHVAEREFYLIMRTQEVVTKLTQLLEEVVIDLCSPETEKTRSVASAPPPCCILHDMFSTWAQDVADNLQLAKHMLYVSPACCLAILFQAPRLRKEGRAPVTPENEHIFLTDIAGLPPIHPRDFPVSLVDATVCQQTERGHSLFRVATVILVNTFHALEWRVLNGIRSQVIGTEDFKTKVVLEIGPLLPEAQFCDDRTDAPMVTHDYDGALPALEFLPPGFEERTKDRGTIYSGWAPQVEILHHPAVGGFLSHSGWNSVLESICAGIPILSWPMIAEQKLICRFLVDTAKLAIEIQKNKDELVTKEEVEWKVRALMQGEEGQCIKRNVVIMQRNARKAVADGGISKQNFEAYIDHLRTGRPLKNAEFNDGEVRSGITGTTHHMDPVS